MTTSRCVKCSNEGHYSSAENAKAIYCKDCFLQMVRHKFSYSLGKHHIFKAAIPENALILYTGDANSALLLSFICDGLSIDSPKKLRIKPSLLFLFDGDDVDKMRQQVDEIHHLMKQYQSHGWILHFAHVASVLSSESEFDCDDIFGINKICQFHSIIRPIKNASLRQEILRILRNVLFVRLARIGKYGHVVFPDNAERLANVSFNALCFGRGSAICELTAVVDNPVADLRFVRPLRDVCDKEVHTYHQLHESSSRFVLTRRASTSDNDVGAVQHGDSGGIQRKNAEFIDALKTGGFPATVPTILSIASKVEPSSKVRAGDHMPDPFLAQNTAVSVERKNCDVCFSAVNDNEDSAAYTTEELCARNRTCEACAAILDELASSGGAGENICGKLMEIIKGV